MHVSGPDFGGRLQREESFGEAGMGYFKPFRINNFGVVEQDVDVDGAAPVDPFSGGAVFGAVFRTAQLPTGSLLALTCVLPVGFLLAPQPSMQA